jgi:regulator of protease activity HflC (stomatin/prohibitin superfamily)
MGFIILFVSLAAALAAIVWIMGKDEDVKPYRFVALLVGLAGLIIATSVSSYNSVDAGNVGLVRSFGAIAGQRPEGMQWVLPWQSVEQASIQVLGHKFAMHRKDDGTADYDDTLHCFSKETQQVYVNATLNIHVSPSHIQRLYREVGANYFEVLVAPRVLQAHKDEIVKYGSVDIAPHREDIRRAVRARLQRELSSDSIDVRDLLIDNIAFDQKFQAAIEEKQTQSQLALAEREKVAAERARADQAIEQARGKADAVLINATKQADANLVLASKEAEANEKLAKSISPALTQYIFAQKLSPNVSVMMVPAGQQFIMSPAMVGK